MILFFFQAEDGIRDRDVTGVQTCALPISACFYRSGALRVLPTAEHPQVLLSSSATADPAGAPLAVARSEEHTSELQSHHDLVCRLLLEKKKKKKKKKKNKEKQKK